MNVPPAPPHPGCVPVNVIPDCPTKILITCPAVKEYDTDVRTTP
jgi:hypothetical protein